MAAYFFRFIDDDDQPFGWIGFVYASNRKTLFWSIDEHGNPYRCQLKRAGYGSYCVYYDDSEGDDWDFEQHEVGESIYRAIHDTKGWKLANWDDVYPHSSSKILVKK